MKVLHVPYSYFPDPVGGTEVYVSTLVRSLTKEGIDCVVAAPGSASSSYVHEGTPVHRVEPGPLRNEPQDLYDLRDPAAADRFDSILQEQKPDVVHLHALTRTVGLSLLDVLERRGIPVVFSYHSPTVTCQRGTLIRWGRTVCDGKIRVHTCSACTLQAGGAPMPLALGIAGTPAPLGKLTVRLSGRTGTAAGMTFLTRTRRDAARSFLKRVDHIIVMASWTLDVLTQNGIATDKTTLSPHGIDGSFEQPNRSPSGTLRLAWLGRVTSEKGLPAVIEVLATVPDAQLELDVFPIVQNPGDQTLLESARSASRDDERIRFREPVEPGEVKETLRAYDALLLTSQGLETGPLVALEAHATGVPVIEPRLGGVAEKVRHGIDGFLFDALEPDSLRALLIDLARDPEKLRELRGKVASPRTIAEASSETMAVYDSVLAER